jgi:hypothetical protein
MASLLHERVVIAAQAGGAATRPEQQPTRRLRAAG